MKKKSGLDYPLSNYDLIGAIAKDMKERGNIVDLREIDKFNNVEHIFKGRGHAILFEMPDTAEDDIGHWTTLLRTKNGDCIYIDSYGDKLSNERLKNILKSKYDLIQYNPKRFQSYKSSVCGRYALTCVGLNKLIPNITVKHIIDFLEAKPKGKSYDQFVLDLTKEI